MHDDAPRVGMGVVLARPDHKKNMHAGCGGTVAIVTAPLNGPPRRDARGKPLPREKGRLVWVRFHVSGIMSPVLPHEIEAVP